MSHIIQLAAANFKTLRAVRITPEGSLISITGKNGAGKTSVLDAIWIALAGKDALPEEPVRKGKSKGHVELTLDNYVVRRTFTSKGTTALTLTDREGNKVSRPQSVLDGLCGSISFDPMQFINDRPVDQVETLRGLLGIGQQLDEIDAERAGLYDQRRNANRRVKELTSQREAFPFDASTPVDEVSATELLKQIEAAQTIRSSKEQARSEYEQAQNRRKGVEADIQRAEDHLKELREYHKSIGDQMNACKKAAQAMGKYPDIEAMRSELESVEQTNAKIRAANSGRAIEQELKHARDDADEFQEKIDGLDVKREQLFESTELPVEGLTFDMEGVRFNDIPLDQCSNSEQLRVSMAIAMALNPELRVIRMTDGSLLDQESRSLVAKMAEEHDFQIFLESVSDEPGESGFHIIDGEVAERS